MFCQQHLFNAVEAAQGGGAQLFHAVETENVREVRRLLKQGAPPDWRNSAEAYSLAAPTPFPGPVPPPAGRPALPPVAARRLRPPAAACGSRPPGCDGGFRA